MTFAMAEALWKKVRDPARGKPLRYNTRLFRLDEDTFGVRYHSTMVVKIHRDGTYTLNNGGWYTYTTKDRINCYSPARLSQKQGRWYLAHWEVDFKNERTWLFQNDVRIDEDGKVLLYPSIEEQLGRVYPE